MNKKIMTGLIGIFILVMVIFVLKKPVLALNLVIHIPDKYLEVTPGEQLTFEVDMKYPENSGQKDLWFTYQIKKGNEIISESKVLKVVGSQSTFMENISVPDSLGVGVYTIASKIQDYEKLNEEVSANFRVVKSKNDLVKYIYILGVVMVMVGFLIVIQFFMILRMKKNEKQ